MRWLLLLIAASAFGQTLTTQRVPLEVKETTWVGSTAPINSHSADPATFGVPIPDSDGITCGGACTVGAVPTNLRVEDVSHTQLPSQFRVTEFWPHTNNAKFVLVDVETSQAAGAADYTNYLCKISTATCGSGGGNSSGANLITDGHDCAGSVNAALACANTGTTKIQLKHINFNLFDDVQDISSGTHIVASGSHGANDGVVLVGPATGLSMPGQVSCLTSGNQDITQCITLYLSNTDASPTFSLEENGPLRSVAKWQGNLISGSTVYAQWTVRETFYKGKSGVQVEVELRNAQTDACVATWTSGSNTCLNNFNTAYKMFRQLELRLTQNIASGARSLTFSGVALPQPPVKATTTLNTSSGSDNAYLYQAFSSVGQWSDFSAQSVCTVEADGCIYPKIFRTNGSTYAQNGWVVKSSQSVTGTVSGSSTSQDGGWADIEDINGAGTEVGIYQLTMNWPASLEYRSAGSEIRVGFYPDQAEWTDACTAGFVDATAVPCHIAYAIPWMGYYKKRAWFNFHGVSIAASNGQADAFLKWQHHEVLRPTPLTNTVPGGQAFAYLNNSKDSVSGIYALGFEQPDPVAEDNYYKTLPGVQAGGAPCNLPAGTCQLDVGATGVSPAMALFNFYCWPCGGGGNDHDFAWSNLLDYEYRGLTGRLVFASHFYDMVNQFIYGHSDFVGGWRGSSGCPSVECPAINGSLFGVFPDNIASTNGKYATRDRPDNLHEHTAGYPVYAVLSGDPAATEQLVQGWADAYLNQNLLPNNPTLTNTSFSPKSRNLGHRFANAAQYSVYLRSIGDANADVLGASNHTVLKMPDLNFGVWVNTPLSVSGFGGSNSCAWPASSGTINTFWYTGFGCSHGYSPVRGLVFMNGDSGENFYYATTQTNVTGQFTGLGSIFPVFNNPSIRTWKPLFTGIFNYGMRQYQLAVDDLEGTLWSYSAGGGTASDIAIRNIMYADGTAITREDWLDAGTCVGGSNVGGTCGSNAECPSSTCTLKYSMSGPIFFSQIDFLNGFGPPGTYTSPPQCTAPPTSTTTNCGNTTGGNGVRICDDGHCKPQESEALWTGIADTTGSVNYMEGTPWKTTFETWMNRTGVAGGQALGGDGWQFDVQGPVLYILHANNDPTPPTQLKPLTITPGTGCSSATGGTISCTGQTSYTFTYSNPADLLAREGLSFWLKTTNNATTIRPWLGFDNHDTTTSNPTGCAVNAVDSATGATSGCFQFDPASNTAFFAASDVASEPTSSGTYTISSLNAGLTYNFSLMYFGNGVAGSTFPLQVTVNFTGGGTVTSSPGGISTSTGQTASFTSGTGVTLSQTTTPSYTFTGWTVDGSGSTCPGTGTCAITMSANHSVTANYIPVTLHVTGIER